MGAGIAEISLSAGFTVFLYDISDSILRSAQARIRTGVKQNHEALRPTTTMEPLRDCSFIIEAASEDLDLKKQIFSALNKIASEEAVLASNTSSISITALAKCVAHPENVVGMHFFNPPSKMKLVEIVRGAVTSRSVVAKATELAKTLGKSAIVVKDSPGFIVNRVARPFYGEALRILAEGVAYAEDIDAIVRLEGGFRMGPFELIDLIGVDVNLAVTQSIYEQTFHEPRFRPHPIQKMMVDAGHLGRKTKRGFYSYEK